MVTQLSGFVLISLTVLTTWANIFVSLPQMDNSFISVPNAEKSPGCVYAEALIILKYRRSQRTQNISLQTTIEGLPYISIRHKTNQQLLSRPHVLS